MFLCRWASFEYVLCSGPRYREYCLEHPWHLQFPGLHSMGSAILLAAVLLSHFSRCQYHGMLQLLLSMSSRSFLPGTCMFFVLRLGIYSSSSPSGCHDALATAPRGAGTSEVRLPTTGALLLAQRRTGIHKRLAARWWEGGTLLQQTRGEWFNCFSSLVAPWRQAWDQCQNKSERCN